MKTLNVTWKGISPLIMHSCKCVNPLHPISIEMKKLTGKKKKTEDDLKRISDLEWVGGAYILDGADCKWAKGEKVKNFDLYIPAENVEATLINGAKSFKRGSDVEKYVMVTDLYIPFEYGENLSADKLVESFEYRDTRAMTVMRSKVMRTRPRFDQWAIQFKMNYDETKIDLDTIMSAMDYAGKYVGLCDSRPKYGKFCVMVEEVD